MSESTIMPFLWTGSEFRPLNPVFQRKAERMFTAGEKYLLEDVQVRSDKSHRHYFSAIREAWQSLPQDLADRFPSPEHLRHYALIKSGYADSQTFVCSSKAQAQKMAAFVRPVDEFSVVIARDTVVERFTAKSQSYKAMGKETFAESKEAVLRVISHMIGVTPKELAAQGKTA